MSDPVATTGATVLDASAVLAWLRAEPGADVVEGHLGNAVMSAVNVSEVHQKLSRHGVDADRTVRRLQVLGVRLEPVDVVDALAASRLWLVTRTVGLSLADRCCLALASRLGAPAVTADRAWVGLDHDVRVIAIR